MSTAKPLPLTEADYEAAAAAYVEGLRPEHFMESVAQSTQKSITVESFHIVHVERPEIQLFSELLLLYPCRGFRSPRQVVPDNVVFVCNEPIDAKSSFNLPLQPVGPFWVMEYVSPGTKRKDYDDSFLKYERELKVPYYLLFYPDNLELTLFRRGSRKYVTTRPNGHGRYLVPELDIELALLDGWVRFWFRGELLPLTAELWREAKAAKRRADEAERRADAAEEELARLCAELARRSPPRANGS